MDIKDAHKVIKNLQTRPYICSENTMELDNGYVIAKKEYFKECQAAAVESMEQHIPQKPVFKNGESVMAVEYADGHGEMKKEKWAEWVCPTCGWFVGQQYIPRKHNQQKCNFCSKCGQAIDWSDTN